jgi:hypothetical protein
MSEPIRGKKILLEEAMSGAEIVVHCVAIAGITGARTDYAVSALVRARTAVEQRPLLHQ